MQQLITSGLVVLRNAKLLLCFSRNKEAWYLPGGKADKGENTVTALLREIREELHVELRPDLLHFYLHISVGAYGEASPIRMEQDCFLYTGEIDPQPSAEILDARYFSPEEYAGETAQVPGVLILFEKLIADGMCNTQTRSLPTNPNKRISL
jgi:8-oxo-dGTP pyrophosphatase MutT (NUDIX family)